MKKYIIIRNGLPTGGVRTAPYAGTLPAGASELEYRNTTRPAAQEGMRVYETFRIEGNVCFQAWRQYPIKETKPAPPTLDDRVAELEEVTGAVVEVLNEKNIIP